MKRPVRGDLALSETRENPTFPISAPADQGEFGMNESGTVSQSGTKLTQPNPVSFNVPPDLKHNMRILRTKFGASTEIGRRCSNVEGAIENLLNPPKEKPAAEFQRANLEASIKWQLAGIARLMTE